MDHVLTLICDPAAPILSPDHVSEVRTAVAGAGAEVGTIDDWLRRGVACDLAFAGADLRRVTEAAHRALTDAPIDVAVQPRRGRRKRLLVCDMDSTIITTECIDELADFAGVREQVAEITRRAMAGELEFAGALRERVALLEGLPETVLERTYAERVRLTPGAHTLVQTMRAHGAFTVLVSGGFRFFTARVAADAGFDLEVANDLELREGRLSGRVREPILDRDTKLATLLRVARERGLDPADALAAGDGANDLPMLLAAGLGVAFHAKPAVAAAAAVRVDHGDLTALLHLQGYRSEEFVTS
jgi:phosphoserine phosphatase